MGVTIAKRNLLYCAEAWSREQSQGNEDCLLVAAREFAKQKKRAANKRDKWKAKKRIGEMGDSPMHDASVVNGD